MKKLLMAGVSLAAITLATVRPGAVTYYRDVLPILQEHCQSCHRPGQLAPMSFLTYRQTRPWAEAIKQVVLATKMPPWSGRGIPAAIRGHAMSATDVETLVLWVEEGAPAGDPKDAPPPAYFEEARLRRVSGN
jgi:hypothetical protein